MAEENKMLISIIIPTYNYEHYIADAMDSIIDQQGYNEEIEIIIVDDGSTDNTKSVVEQYKDKLKIKYIYQENKGKASATKLAISLTTGKYIFNLDADDKFLKEKIAKTVEIFEKNSTIVHVATPARIEYSVDRISSIEKIPFEILDREINGDQLLLFFYKQNILFGGGSTFVARGNELRSINIPDDVDMYIDEFLLLAILPKGNSYFISEPLSIWRVHGNNYSHGGNTKEINIARAKRLLNSSNAVMNYLKSESTNFQLVNIYELKNEIRKLAIFETDETKSFQHIYMFFVKVFYLLRIDFFTLLKYKTFNRLIPMRLYVLLKKMNKKRGL